MENVFNQSIWGDEGFSAILSMKPLPEIIKIIIRDTSPPLWNIFEHFAFQIFGTGEVVIRGLAFTFFTLTIFFIYKIGALLWNRKTGVFAAMLTFLNPFFFTYAYEGRMYSILALGVTASMYFFLKIVRSEKKIKKTDAIGYVVATLWAMYSHHFAIFAIFIQGMWFIFEFLFGGRKTAKKLFKLFILVGVGYIPWVYPLYLQTRMVGRGFWLGTPTPKDLLGLLAEYLAAGIRNKDVVIPILKIEAYKVGLVLIAFILIFRRWTKDAKKTLFILSWFLGPILLTWAVSQKFTSIFFNRYLLYAIPAAMILAVSERRGKISLVLVISALVIFSVVDLHYFTHPNKLPFRELAAYVKSTKGKGDFLINWNSRAHHLWETKYYGIPAPIYIPGEVNLPFFVGTALMEKADIISEIPKDVKKIGVVTSGPIEEVSLPGYTERAVEKFGSLSFIWYEKLK